MAKSSGLGDNLLIGGYVIGADTNAVDRVGGGPALLELTDITQSAIDREGGQRDGAIEISCWFDAADNALHDALSTLPTTDRIVSYLRGQALGNPVASLVAKQINYDWSRGNDGSLSGKVEAQGSGYGLEWGDQLTAGLRTDTAATNGASIDTTASASFGAQAYLQLNAFTGTDVTVKIQDSANDSTWADVTGLAFTQITGGAPTAERIATAAGATIRRYLRAITVTTGGVTSVSFTVAIVKNETSIAF